MAFGAWEPHARLMALLAEINRDPKKRKQPYQSCDFNPYADNLDRVRKDVLTPERLHAITDVITAKH